MDMLLWLVSVWTVTSIIGQILIKIGDKISGRYSLYPLYIRMLMLACGPAMGVIGVIVFAISFWDWIYPTVQKILYYEL